MHYQSLFLSVLLVAVSVTPAFAREVPGLPFENPSSFWLGGIPERTATPDGAAESRTLFRFISGDGFALSPAAITYIKLPLPAKGRAQTPEEFISFLKGGMGIPTWIHRELKGGTHAWDSYWPGNHRFIRAYYRAGAREAQYSIALYRPAFADRLAIETEILQRQLMGLEVRHTAASEAAQALFAAWALIALPEASAQQPGLPSLPQLPTLPTGGTSAASGTAGGTLGDLGALNTNLQNLNSLGSSLENLGSLGNQFMTQLPGITSQLQGGMASLQQQLGQLSGTFHTDMQSITEQARSFENTFGRIGTDMNTNFADMNTNFKALVGPDGEMEKWRKFMEKSQSSANLARIGFVTGAATAAGAVVGRELASDGIALIKFGLQKAHLAHFDKESREQAERELREHVTLYNSMRTQVRQAEQNADQLIQTVRRLQGTGVRSTEDVLTYVNGMKWLAGRAKKDGERYADILQTIDPEGKQAGALVTGIAGSIGALDTETDHLDEVAKVFKKASVKQVCDTLGETITSLRRSETELFLAGLDLGAKRDALDELARNKNRKMKDDARKVDSKGNTRSIAGDEDKRAARDTAYIRSELERERAALVSSCASNVGSARKKIRDKKMRKSITDEAVKDACVRYVEGAPVTDNNLASLLSSSNGSVQARLRGYQENHRDQATAEAMIERARTDVRAASEKRADQGETHVSPLSVANLHATDAALTTQLLNETTTEFQRQKMRELQGYQQGAAEACGFLGVSLEVRRDPCAATNEADRLDSRCVLSTPVQNGAESKPEDKSPAGSPPAGTTTRPPAVTQSTASNSS